MIFFRIVCLFFLCVIPSLCFGLDKNLNSSCMVESNHGLYQSSVGSGTVCSENETKYFILSSGHVARHIRNFSVRFFRNDVLSKSIQADKVRVWYQENTDVDMAILSVDKSRLGFKPEVIWLAPKGTGIVLGERISCAAFPNGNWCHAWSGKITSLRGSRFYFNATPIEGQSGSCITKMINGEPRIVGITTWSYGNKKSPARHFMTPYGGAISLSQIYALLDNNYNTIKVIQ